MTIPLGESDHEYDDVTDEEQVMDTSEDDDDSDGLQIDIPKPYKDLNVATAACTNRCKTFCKTLTLHEASLDGKKTKTNTALIHKKLVLKSRPIPPLPTMNQLVNNRPTDSQLARFGIKYAPVNTNTDDRTYVYLDHRKRSRFTSFPVDDEIGSEQSPADVFSLNLLFQNLAVPSKGSQVIFNKKLMVRIGSENSKRGQKTFLIVRNDKNELNMALFEGQAYTYMKSICLNQKEFFYFLSQLFNLHVAVVLAELYDIEKMLQIRRTLRIGTSSPYPCINFRFFSTYNFPTSGLTLNLAETSALQQVLVTLAIKTFPDLAEFMNCEQIHGPQINQACVVCSEAEQLPDLK